MSTRTIKAQLVDISSRKIRPAAIEITDGRITGIRDIPASECETEGFVMPGFIDSHVHVESSMLVPAEFARLAVVHGTVGTVSDPHEIANVCGIEGVRYMIRNGKTVPFKFCFGAPSCVPATVFETAGASINAEQVEALLSLSDIGYLSEMMNFPGVLQQDPEVMQKIAAAKKYNKPVDGHAPGLRGDDARKYIAAGISTDHECFTAEEALDKLNLGMKILVREGSAARNFDALIGLMHDHYGQMMFCSDDKHPDSLAIGHINQLCARAVASGIDVFKVLQAACINPVEHYKMPIGLLRVGDPADYIIVKDLTEFRVLATYIDGELVAENGQTRIQAGKPDIINQFDAEPRIPADFIVPYSGEATIPVIEALDGQLITNRLNLEPTVRDRQIVADPAKDVLKIAVINRYHQAPVALAFIRNIGLQHGAIASTVAHDSHNIVAVGADDESLCRAVNLLIEQRGGVSAVGLGEESVLPLPVAGLMSDRDGYAVASAYTEIDRMAKDRLGCKVSAPFMTLSFMALLVIPHLKLSDKGLFDGDSFSFV